MLGILAGIALPLRVPLVIEFPPLVFAFGMKGEHERHVSVIDGLLPIVGFAHYDLLTAIFAAVLFTRFRRRFV